MYSFISILSFCVYLSFRLDCYFTSIAVVWCVLSSSSWWVHGFWFQIHLQHSKFVKFLHYSLPNFSVPFFGSPTQNHSIKPVLMQFKTVLLLLSVISIQFLPYSLHSNSSICDPSNTPNLFLFSFLISIPCYTTCYSFLTAILNFFIRFLSWFLIWFLLIFESVYFSIAISYRFIWLSFVFRSLYSFSTLSLHSCASGSFFRSISKCQRMLHHSLWIVTLHQQQLCDASGSVEADQFLALNSSPTFETLWIFYISLCRTFPYHNLDPLPGTIQFNPNILLISITNSIWTKQTGEKLGQEKRKIITS